MYQNKMMIKNENMLRQENNRELDKAADIILGTKDIIRTGFNALDNLSAWSGLGTV